MLTRYSSAGFPAETELDRCRSYVAYQHDHPKRPSASGVWAVPGPAVTLSPLTGAATDAVATRLAEVLESREHAAHAPWTVFDRQLVRIALEEHQLPTTLAKFMPEDRRSYFDDVIDEMIGLRPPSWQIIPKIVQSVQHLAGAGHVILVGRGAGIATRGMPNVFHVRLIASLPNRIARIQKLENISAKEAAKLIARNDRGRARYIKTHFHARVDDDLQYHLVLNTDLIPPPDAAELIADGACRYFQNTLRQP